jgi:hypothetical protein
MNGRQGRASQAREDNIVDPHYRYVFRYAKTCFLKRTNRADCNQVIAAKQRTGQGGLAE